MSRVIRKASDLAPGKPILIYGAGERGSKFAHALRLAGHVCRGFLDSFKAGEQDGLPVYHYPDVPTELFDNCRVVVASCKHTAIANVLSMDGHAAFHILADEGETLEYVFLAEDAAETVEMLSPRSRSLVHNVSERQPKPGYSWSCTYLDQGLWLGVDALKYCCFLPDIAYYQPAAQLMESLNAVRRGIYARLDAGLPTPCVGCAHLVESDSRPSAYRIGNLGLGYNSRCNFNCSYCNVRKDGQTNSKGLALRLVRELIDAGELDSGVAFGWAGEGEPVLDEFFEPLMEMLLNLGASGIVYSNASIHSPLLERGLREDRLTLTTSIDAGTPATFQRMHHTDAFDRVVANLRRYRANCGPDRITLKFIQTSDNAGEEEIRAFLALCRSLDIRKIALSADYTQEGSVFAEQTTSFRRQALAAGLEVDVVPWI
jgi:hypothetical protein